MRVRNSDVRDKLRLADLWKIQPSAGVNISSGVNTSKGDETQNNLHGCSKSVITEVFSRVFIFLTIFDFDCGERAG